MYVYLPDPESGRGQWFVVDSKRNLVDVAFDALELVGEQISFDDVLYSMEDE